MYKYITALLLAVMIISCRPQQQQDRNYFCYNQIGGLETLDPAFAKNLSIMWGVTFLYNTLVEIDENMQLQPSLATSWTVSPDGKVLTFNIRKDVYFHDNPVFKDGRGRALTAHDIVYTFSRLTDPATASSGAWIFHDKIAEHAPFDAPDDTTFILRLRQAFPPMLSMLSMPYCAIVPHEAIRKWGKDFRNHPVGTGPFRFQLWDENNVLLLQKNPAYWEKDAKGKRLPYLDGIKVTFNETRIMEFLLFRQQQLDFINGIDGSVKDLVLSKKGLLKDEFRDNFRLTKQLYLNTEYLGFLLDTTLPALRNQPVRHRLVRQAINHAIDKAKIVTFFRNGVGIPADKGFIPEGLIPEEQATVAYGYAYNPALATALLEEAGWQDSRTFGLIKLYCPESQTDICNFIVTQLQDIGLQATVEVMQPGLLRQMMSKTEAPFFKAQWIADYPDAETYLSFFYSRNPAPPNYTRFNNPYFDRLYQESIRTGDDAHRYGLYQRMDSLVMAEAAIVPLFYDEILHFTQHNIHNLKRNALNILNVKYVEKK